MNTIYDVTGGNIKMLYNKLNFHFSLKLTTCYKNSINIIQFKLSSEVKSINTDA